MAFVKIKETEIDLAKLNLGFDTLNEDQVNALNHIADFLQDKKAKATVLSGSAGTGKSSIVKILKHYIEVSEEVNFHISLAAPTHKAKIVLNRLTDSRQSCQTLHKLLGLRPDLSIKDFDARELQFALNIGLSFLVMETDLFIIDECSMINDFLYDLIISKLCKNGSKVLFIGDSKQLSPVKQSTISKCFTSTDYPGVFLHRIMRQIDGNPLLKTLSVLRDRPMDLSEFNTEITTESGLFATPDTQEYVNKMMDYKNLDFREDYFDLKLLCYTNHRVGQYNKFFRQKVLNFTKPLNIGELLIGNDNYTVNRAEIIYNGSEYIIVNYRYLEQRLNDVINAKGYQVELYDMVDQEYFTIYLLDPEASDKMYYEIAQRLENYRLIAIDPTVKGYVRKGYWKKYFGLLQSFTTPKDLVYQNRIVRKATFNYGYAITTHKSQGSTYKDVFVDLQDINKCISDTERRELQYVALSRATNNAHVLI